MLGVATEVAEEGGAAVDDENAAAAADDSDCPVLACRRVYSYAR